MPEGKFISVKEAAELLEVDETTIRRLCRQKKLTCERYGSVRIVLEESVKNYKKSPKGRKRKSKS